ncbi:hypothetical protein ASZ90_018830 [hydrocarbon metagenome]|uniref:Uracil-DNA glycosylase-like domain-containing protein n=1 Tax=hydrocarbon metagenome TaxID=938273 RepID=A0A0W8E5A8_9ZZZZ
MAADGRREQNIRFIIEMEDRIAQCKRCKSLLSCIRKPSMGKGDLEPDIILVFENDTKAAQNSDKLLELREMIKSEFNTSKIYHTFMVRCQPKACAIRSNTSCYMDNKKLIDRDYNCLLSGKSCEGIPIKPADDSIISCLPFLLEEVEILDPSTVILFGERVSDFVLKSYGIFDDIKPGDTFYDSTGRVFISVPIQEEFTLEECHKIRATVLSAENQS